MKSFRIIASLVFATALGLGSAVAQDADAYTQFDKKPLPTRTPPPAYPASLSGVDGIVAVTVVVDEQGSVVEATVTKSTRTEFEASAIEAIRQWKFQPAQRGGQPVKARIQIPLHFSSGA
jgi:TonB family protein